MQAFEELLRANDIDYYMGQSFREQLAQNTALAQRVASKIRGRKQRLLLCSRVQVPSLVRVVTPNRNFSKASLLATGDRAESHEDKADHELLALR